MRFDETLYLGYVASILLSCLVSIWAARTGRNPRIYSYFPETQAVELIFIFLPVWNVFWFGLKLFRKPW
jgi:hypothetical protein